jgi:hypothetical protein
VRNLPTHVSVCLTIAAMGWPLALSGCGGVRCNSSCQEILRKCASRCSLRILTGTAAEYCRENPGDGGCP